MFRLGVLVLMLMYSVVPPGICLCRLSELVSPCDDFDPTDFDGEDHCECPRIQQDGVVGEAAPATSPPCLAHGLLDSTGPPIVSGLHMSIARADEITPAQPIYLALRALRI